MSELTLTVMRLGFLAVLWLFVIVAVQVIRSDLFGTRVTQRGSRREAARAPQQAAAPAGATAAAPAARRRAAASAAAHPPSWWSPRASSPARPWRSRARPSRWAGRTTSTIVLDDDYASSRHARIYPDRDGQWIVEDLGSTNGTYLDRNRLTTPTPIPLGAPIRIGKTVIELRK